jgi:hypothetical protein
MTHEALVRRIQLLILSQLEAADRLGREPALRATSLADQVLAGAHGHTAAEFLRDAAARVEAARKEWTERADDPAGYGADALAELAQELLRLIDES